MYISGQMRSASESARWESEHLQQAADVERRSRIKRIHGTVVVFGHQCSYQRRMTLCLHSQDSSSPHTAPSAVEDGQTQIILPFPCMRINSRGDVTSKPNHTTVTIKKEGRGKLSFHASSIFKSFRWYNLNKPLLYMVDSWLNPTQEYLLENFDEKS